MAVNGQRIQWNTLRHMVLCARSTALLGAATDTSDQPTLAFAATSFPNGDIVITVNGAVTLADVHDLCARTARACLDDDPHVTFERSEQD
jgi:hypothetical protein